VETREAMQLPIDPGDSHRARQSLKDRGSVRSLKDQLKQGFNVSVAELDEAVTWQSATLGVWRFRFSRLPA